MNSAADAVPAHDLTRIFEPFYSRKKMGQSGTGLGMTVVWATVKDHKGYIDLHSREVDLLVLDMIMEPGIDGLETYRRIISIKPGQKAIVASGFSESERVKALQQLSAGAYIRKPYTMQSIGVAIRKQLSRN